MSTPIKGLGVCLIPGEDGTPCGRQIEEGEPIGTVIHGGPQVGHKRCANAFYIRKQDEERQKREDMVKIGKQQGPGGSIGDPATYPDALASGSVPLEKKAEEDKPVTSAPPTGVPDSSPPDAPKVGHQATILDEGDTLYVGVLNNGKFSEIRLSKTQGKLLITHENGSLIVGT